MPLRFRVTDLEMLDCGQETRWAVNRATGCVEALNPGEVEALGRMRRYLPLDEHARQWARLDQIKPLRSLVSHGPKAAQRWVDRTGRRLSPNESHLQAAQERLAELVEAGVLVSDEGFVADVARSSSDHTRPARIERVCFTTRNRPEALRRALDSFVANDREFGRGTTLVVVDDAREHDGEAATAAMLGKLEVNPGAPVRHLGLEWREEFARRLASESGVDLAVARFAVLGDARCPVTTGSARNTVLLDSVQRPFLLADDDAVCRAAPCPQRIEGLTLSSVGDPTLFWFYRSRAEMLEQARFVSMDLLAAHEELLGWSLKQKLAAGPTALSLDAMSPAFDRLMRAQGGRIQATMAGVVGDSGVASGSYLYINPPSAARISKSEEGFRAAVESRQLLRAVPNQTVGGSPFCMAASLALDTRRLTPPFTPVQRNSDGLFGRLLISCVPESLTGYVPYAVLHDPLETRRQSFDALRADTARIRYPDILAGLVAAWRPSERQQTAAQRFESLGAEIQELSRDVGRFRSALAETILPQLARRLARDRSEQERTLPRFYVELRREWEHRWRTAASSPEYFVPRDFIAAGHDDEAAFELARDITFQVGGLYRAWPALWQAAESDAG